jgi:transcriptional regulator with XRE-family HTH domain
MSKELASKLKLVRNTLNLTQASLAKELSVATGTLSHWEQDVNTPRGFALKALNDRLDALLQPKPSPPSASPSPSAGRSKKRAK